MQHGVQICFFAHSPEEVRHPSTKPFVPPEALAAATTNATMEAVRKAAAESDASKKEVRALHAAWLAVGALPRSWSSMLFGSSVDSGH